MPPIGSRSGGSIGRAARAILKKLLDGGHPAATFHNSRIAPLAQLDRASGYEPEGREFESLRARHVFSFLRAPNHIVRLLCTISIVVHFTCEMRGGSRRVTRVVA
jgi:hypothetical protein